MLSEMDSHPDLNTPNSKQAAMKAVEAAAKPVVAAVTEVKQVTAAAAAALRRRRLVDNAEGFVFFVRFFSD